MTWPAGPTGPTAPGARPSLRLDPQTLLGILDATPALILIVDAAGTVSAANRAVEEATGLPREKLERPLWELAVAPEERASLEATFGAARREAVPPTVLFHLATAERGARAVDWNVRALEGPEGAPLLVLTGIDLPRRREAERHLHEAEASQRLILDRLRFSEARLRQLFDANVIGVIFENGAGTITDANDAFLRMLGYSRAELAAGRLAWPTLTPPEHRLADERALAEMRSGGRFVPYEKEYLAKDGTRVPILIGGATIPHADSGPTEAVAFVLDIREQVQLRRARDQLLLKEQAARLDTERANARLLLLVEGSRRLSRSLNIGSTLETLATLVVPTLADWSYVVHMGWNGGPGVVAAAHGDPNKQPLLERLRSCRPDASAPEGAARAFRTGEVVSYSDITPEQLSLGTGGWPLVGTRDPDHLHTLRELGMRSLLCVPIRGRAGVDAVIMLASEVDPHRYDADDVVLAQDLADRTAVALENGRLLSEALEAVRARDDFLAVAAHELRSPLTSLLLQVQVLGRAILRERFDADVARRAVGVAEAQARRLSTLIDGMLDVSRFATNQLFVHLEDVDLRELLDELLATLSTSLERSGCRVSLSAPGKLVGRWDRGRIEQVLANLLSNAMKFGAGMPIEVDVDANDELVHIAVSDHGIGISMEDQARIFERFERAVPTRHFGGLGLGLYTSVQILRAHQGSLHVDSREGRGARFVIDLPRGQRGSSLSQPASLGRGH
jgi:PAS domain S-box-containing protein